MPTEAPTSDPSILIFPAFNGVSLTLSIVNIAAIAVKNGYSRCTRFDISTLKNTATEVFIFFIPIPSFVLPLR
jgi:hypothetical protein